MKKLFTSIIIFFCFETSFAQNYVDVLKLNLNTTSLNKFDSSLNSTRINEISADLTFPKKINEKLAIITGGTYEKIQTKVFENQSSISIYSISLKAGFNKNIGNKWTVSFILLPKFASDFVDLGQKDFQLGGITMFKYSKSNDLNYKFALYYNSEFFGPIVVPMFGMYYLSSNKKWESNLMLPLQADVNYKVTKHLTVGLNYNGQIRTYNLTKISPLNYGTYVAKSSNELCAYIKLNLTKGLSLQTKIGHTLGRNYRVYDENDKVKFALPLVYFGDKRKQLNTDFENGLLLQFQFLYRVNL